jgi:transposase
LTEREFTKILDWPGYRVYRHEIDEKTRTLKLWVRRKRGNKVLICSGCGGRCGKIEEVRERAVRDLPWRKYQTVVMVEYFRVRCPKCGLKVEVVPQLPSKAPFSKDFEDAVGLACESAAARQVARQFGLAAGTVRAIDQRYLERWSRNRRKPVLRQIGVDEIYLGKTQKFLTVVSNLETGEPLWFGQGRKRETLDEFFKGLSSLQRGRITAACVDMWEPFTAGILSWVPQCRIVYDKFHVMQHAGKAVDEVRRAEFFRKGGRMRGLVKGKRWLLLSRWVNLDSRKRQLLNELFRLNRRMMKAYLLKESLDRLWTYRYEGAALRYLNQWIDQLRWQRLEPFKKLTRLRLRPTSCIPLVRGILHNPKSGSGRQGELQAVPPMI